MRIKRTVLSSKELRHGTEIEQTLKQGVVHIKRVGPALPTDANHNLAGFFQRGIVVI